MVGRKLSGIGVGNTVRLSDARDAVDKSIDLEVLKTVILADPRFDGKTHDAYDSGLTFDNVSMGDLIQYIKDNKDDLEVKMQMLKEEEEKAIAAQEEIRKAAAKVMVTSGYNFEGYRITRYSGYISGDDATQINRGGLFEDKGQALTDALVVIRRQALKELKEAAVALGCNAVIAVDFDYMTFEPETIEGTIHYYEPYVVCVTANGTAVCIEKE